MQYLDWQRELGKTQPRVAFAKWLGIPQPTLSAYLHGRRSPQGFTVDKLAEKLGVEVYDVLGLKRPDPWLRLVLRMWQDLHEEDQQSVIEMMQEMVARRQGEKAEAENGETFLPDRGSI